MPSQDRSPTLAELLTHADWVKALARHLVRDRDAAEDVAQDALVVALRRPPSASGALRAWLARVVTNRARKHGRASTARARREQRAVSLETAPATSDVVARGELHRLLTDLVLQLDEPYRTTILARFFDGESAEQIAAREGVPASTVRNRVARGIALLRGRLDARCGGDRARWAPAVAALAVPADAAAASAATSSSLLGGLVMASFNKLVLGATAALLAAGAAWLVWPATESLEAPASVDAGARSIPVESRDAPAAERVAMPRAESAPQPSARPRGRAAERTASATSGLVPRGMIEVVAMSELGPPPRGTARAKGTGPRDAQSLELDPSGKALLGVLPRDSYRVTLELESGLVVEAPERIELGPAEGRRCTFAFGSASVHGTTYDADGKPVSGIAVQVEGGGWLCKRETDAAGHYDVGHVPGGARWVALPDGESTKLSLGDPLMQEVLHAPGASQRVDFGSPHGLTTWSGAVRSSAAAPLLATAKLHLQRSSDGRYQELWTKPDGSFTGRIEPGTWDVAITPPSGGPRQNIGPPLEIGAAAVQRDLTLPGTRLRVRVTVAAGSDPRLGHLRVEAHPPKDHSRIHRAAPVGNGTWTFDGLPAGTWVLTAYPREPTAPREIVVRASDVELEAELEVR